MIKEILNQCQDRAQFARSSRDERLMREVYGECRMARIMRAISEEQFRELNAILVRDGINKPSSYDDYAWISVDDRLPEEDLDVFVCTKSKNGSRNIDKGYYAEGRWVHRGTADVTHWMYIPGIPAD